MIKDKIENISRYSINDVFEEFKRIVQNEEKGIDLSPSSIKKVEISYDTKDFNLSEFENHQKFIDVHLILAGKERIALNDVKNLREISDYEEERDFQIFGGEIENEINLLKGEFLVLFPGEAHITGGKFREQKEIKKIVYKIPDS